MTIPPCVHFCWIGPQLPWAYVFAVLSAAERSGMQQIILHHTDPLADGPQLRALISVPRVRLVRIDPLACLAQAASQVGLEDELAALYRRVSSPVVRSDILRATILYLQGGVYLDLDTITTGSLLPLLETPQFVATEFVVWPSLVLKSRSPVIWARALTLDLLRKLLRRLPAGWRMFRRFERCYFRGVNNAVMGAEAHSPLLAEYLRAMVVLPPAIQLRSYALGPDLLQEVVDRYPRTALTIVDPHVFFPLAPEISEHWFRETAKPRLDLVLCAETRVVHWYASVRSRPRVAQISPEYVAAKRNTQLYSALVCACIATLPAPV